MKINGISLFFGLVITIFLCLMWVSMVSSDPMYRWPGILAIIILVFFAGLETVPIEHFEVVKIFGSRQNIVFKEGLRWLPLLIANTDDVSGKDIVVDVPPIQVITKDKVEVVFDVWVWLKVKDPFTILNLENPVETIKTSTVSKSNDASWKFGGSHTYNQCLSGKEKIQNEIKREMSKEEDRLGVEVTNIDIKPVLPTDEVRKELSEDKKKEIRVKRFKKSLEEIRDGAPEISDDTLTNIAQVVEGGEKVKKEIKEEKKTIKLDVESDILKLVAELLPKKGDKK